MTFLHTVLAFLAALAVLIVVHELGHYWVARLCNVKVLRFSVGMGRVVWSRRFGPDQTEWALSALPFGGYVKMLDAREQDVGTLSEQDLKREFTRQSVWKRIAIVAAGPLANFLLAIALFAGLYSYGLPEPAATLRDVPQQTAAYEAGLRGGERVRAVDGSAVQTWGELRWKIMQAVLDQRPARLEVEDGEGRGAVRQVTLRLGGVSASDLETDFLGRLGLDLARPPAVLGRIVPGGPADAADLREGDRVLSVNGEPVADGLAFVERVRTAPGQELALQVQRAGQQLQRVVRPEAHSVRDQVVGRIQVEVPLAPDMVTVRSGPLEAVARGAERTWDTSVLTLKMLGKMLVGEISWKNISGPITIADYAGQTARIGLVSYLTFLAFISISLGVMNLLPIPVLDGGHLLYYSLELLTGRPVSERFGEIAQRAGVGILMVLMAVAVFNDILRLVS
ncbi:MAG TPA: RIP metalloprotease RseP [Noviherbaspirillum sp.]|nr:RIP metalloprotease RseP [Noviherbaspirillum sp.]